MKTLLERFEAKIDKSSGNCWVWTASKDRGGYGRFGYKGKVRWAHRISWLLYRGEEAENICVLHRCDTPSCVNPDHLFLGTQKDNAIDRNQKGRSNPPIGERARTAKLSKKDVLLIRQLLSAGRSVQIVSQKFGISHSAISHIAHRRTWRHV